MQPKKIYNFKSQFFLLPVQLMQESNIMIV